MGGLRRAVRGLRTNPAYTAAALLTLGVGVGATSAVFGLAHWAFLRPVPAVEQPDALSNVLFRDDVSGGIQMVSHPHLIEALAPGGAVSSGAAYSPIPLDVRITEAGEVIRVGGQLVTPGFFETLGVGTPLGRGFTAEEGEAANVHPVAVLGHAFWQSRYGGARDVLGRTLDLNGTDFEIVGVAAPGFVGPDRTDDISVWVPSSAAPVALPRMPANLLSIERAPVWLRAVVRRAPAATPEAVATQLEATRLGRTESLTVQATRFGLAPFLADRLAGTLAVAGSLVGLLLLLTVANLVNLTVSRAARRSGDAVIRRALGASPLRIAGFMAVEGLVVGLLGTGVALVTGRGMMRLLDGVAVLPDSTLPVPTFELEVVGFVLIVSLVCAGMASALAAWSVRRLSAVSVLRTRQDALPSGRRLRRAAVVFQMSVALALVAGANLMLRSVAELNDIELGFDPAGVLVFSLNPGVQGYSDVESDQLFRDLTRSFDALPEVESSGFTWLEPLGLRRYSEEIVGQGSRSVTAQANMASPGYFDALGMRLLEGRVFDDREYERRERPERGAVVLNRTAADALFPDGGALGREVRMPGRRELGFEVIGVIEDARLATVQEAPGPYVFDPFGNGYATTSATFALRTADDSTILLTRVRDIVRERDSRLPVLDGQALALKIGNATREERALARVTAVLAALSLMLAAAGLFGLVSEMVQARAGEFGVRSALGARGIDIAGLVLREGFALMLAGTLLGLAGGTLLAQFLESSLYGVPALDPMSFAMAALVLAAVTLLAALGPTAKAAAIEPVRALRTD